MKQTLSNQRGMALLLVLVVVALLSALLTELAFSTLVDLRLAETFRDSTRAAYLAKGGVRVGRALLQEDRNSWDHRSEFWGIGVVGYPVGDGFVSVEVKDQDGLLNLNRLVPGGIDYPAYKGRVYKLFRELGLPDPEDLTAALIDWVDSDSNVFNDNLNSQMVGNGAEENYYQGLNPPTHCKNAPLDSLEELASIRGFTPEIRAAIDEFVTAYGGQKLNINTAPTQVLYAWYDWETPTLDDRLAITISEARDSVPIKDKNELIALVGINDFSILNQQSDIAYTSTTYFIRSTGEVGSAGNGPAGARTVEAMIGKLNDKLLYLKVH